MNRYLIPAEYELTSDFELPIKRPAKPGIRWLAASAAVLVVLATTLAVADSGGRHAGSKPAAVSSVAATR